MATRALLSSTGGAVRLITNTFDLEISRNATTWYKYEVRRSHPLMLSLMSPPLTSP